MRKLIRLCAALIAFAVMLTAAGCSSVEPKPVPGATVPPLSTPAPSETPVDTQPPEPQTTESAAPGAHIDALGNVIYTADHFERYITFQNILVYEELIFTGDGPIEETLIDCTVKNDYPELLLCAVNIDFLDENGMVIASGSLQMPDGSFLLALEGGETPLYARILTDTRLTDKNYRLSFDPATGVHPQL